jgi:glycosyltransferase involved in cell wall biosynthesis
VGVLPVVLNDRAGERSTITGVERWAREVIPRLLRLRPDRYVRVVPPPGFANRAGQAWEQIVLPARALSLRAALVFSPANLGPVLWPRNVVVVHDAAVLRNPGDYSRAYREWHSRVGLACARRASRVVTVSEFSRTELVALAGLDPARVTVVPGGVDERFSADVDRDRVATKYGLDHPYVLTVGTADRRKNVSVLVEAAERLRPLGIQVAWAGGSRPHLLGERSVAGIRPLGYVTDRDLPGLYAGARAFVLPSLYEGFGLTCIEAMASGTPVVASNRAALPETCGEAALLVDPLDPVAVADAVIRAATDDDLRSQLREKGLRRAAECSWDRTAAEIDVLLTKLAGTL